MGATPSTRGNRFAHIQMEPIFFDLFIAGGELFEYILAHRSLKEKDARRLFAQLVSSVQYMHRKKVVHRDLKLVRR